MPKKKIYPSPMLDTAKIRQLRTAAGLSMETAAKAAGFKSRQMWFHVESGKTTNVELLTLGRIASALGCDPKSLLK